MGKNEEKKKNYEWVDYFHDCIFSQNENEKKKKKNRKYATMLPILNYSTQTVKKQQ